MTLALYHHPFASFCQKVLVALYEKDMAFEREHIDLFEPDQRARLVALWPFGKFPVLEDRTAGRVIAESGVIIDYLDHLQPDPPLVPADPLAASEARTLERVADNILAVSVTKIVTDRFRPADGHDPIGVEQARDAIVTALDFLEGRLTGRGWAAGETFGLADCALAPTLFYAGTIVPFRDRTILSAYYRRLMARPSVARVVEEARPWRHLFPLPWPADYD
jgi:glutathione S-transferase